KFFWINQVLMRHEDQAYVFVDLSVVNDIDQTLGEIVQFLNEPEAVLFAVSPYQTNDEAHIDFAAVAVHSELIRAGLGYFLPISSPYAILNFLVRLEAYASHSPSHALSRL